MKFWRRHKHELNRTDADEPLPQPPDKKMRYSREDDILLARYFFSKPEGTSDQIFQAFGRMVRVCSSDLVQLKLTCIIVFSSSLERLARASSNS